MHIIDTHKYVATCMRDRYKLTFYQVPCMHVAKKLIYEVYDIDCKICRLCKFSVSIAKSCWNSMLKGNSEELSYNRPFTYLLSHFSWDININLSYLVINNLVT